MGGENPRSILLSERCYQVNFGDHWSDEEWLLDNLSKLGYDNVANIFEYDKGVVSVVTYMNKKNLRSLPQVSITGIYVHYSKTLVVSS